MRRGNSKGAGTLLLFLLAGIIIGGLVGDMLAYYVNLPILQHSMQLGTQGGPTWVDLSIIKIAFGLALNINVGTLLGVILGLIFFYRA